MTSVRVKYRPSSVPGAEGSIFYQVIHNRLVRHIGTGYKVCAKEWDDNRSMVTTKDNERLPFIMSLRERIRWDVERLMKIDKQLDDNNLNYTTDDIVEEFKKFASEFSLFNFMENIIARLRQAGQEGTARSHKSALSRFKKFRNDEDILMDYISAKVIEDYQIWMKGNGLCQNTISFHNRILRSVYNKAVEMDAIVDRQPFKKAYTGIDKTVKRALPIKLLKKMKNLDLSLNPQLDLARDLFLLSFYLRGMSFIDMAFLKRDDLKDKRVTYRRHKTGQLLTIEWTKEMEAILKKHPSKHPVFLLPIIPVDAENERRAYVYQLARVNRRLKEIGTMLGITIPLTTYNARHSWASAAKVRNVSISIISEGLGHDSETTTQIYLASLDTSAVDKANRKVISSLD